MVLISRKKRLAAVLLSLLLLGGCAGSPSVSQASDPSSGATAVSTEPAGSTDNWSPMSIKTDPTTTQGTTHNTTVPTQKPTTAPTTAPTESQNKVYAMYNLDEFTQKF